MSREPARVHARKRLPVRRLSAPLVLAVLLAAPLALTLQADADAAIERPDLRVTTLHLMGGGWSTPLSGPPAPRAFTILVENVGTATSPEAIVEFAVIRPNGLRDVLVGFESFPLPPGGRETFRGQWTPPPNHIGDYDLVATVDPQNDVAELDEFNNAAHARGSHAPVPGVIYPARRTLADPSPSGSVTVGHPWARFALDRHDTDNPAPFLLLDRSGNARDAKLPAGTPLRLPGALDDARRFDGGPYVDAPLPPSTSTTLAFWVRTESASSAGPLVTTPAPGCARTALTLESAGTLGLDLPAAEGIGCGTRHRAAGVIPTGAWTHVALVAHDRSAVVFVDGAPVIEHAFEPGTVSGFPATRALLGAALTSGGEPVGVTGVALDEFLVFNRALSPVEIGLLAEGRVA